MKCDELKRHRPDIMVVGEGKAMAVMPEDPMGVWCHIQDVHDLLAEKDAEIEKLKARIQLDDDEMAGFLQLEEECGGGDLRNYIAELKAKLDEKFKHNKSKAQ